MQTHVRIRLSGKVQGVGFRPFIYTLANQLNLSGYAINLISSLDIYLYGEKENIETFENKLINNAQQHQKPQPLFRQIGRYAKHACLSSLTQKIVVTYSLLSAVLNAGPEPASPIERLMIE